MDEEMCSSLRCQENIEWLKTKGVKFIEPVKGAFSKRPYRHGQNA